MTLLNFSFLFRRCKVKFWCCFIVAKGFHFPKHPFVLSFHSLLTHLLRFESAVLLFDCGRNKLAAESIPQFFSKLGAIVFFAAFFLKRKRVFLRPPSYPLLLCVCYAGEVKESGFAAVETGSSADKAFGEEEIYSDRARFIDGN